MSDAPTRVHPTAAIDPDARLGTGVQVGAYAVIGAGVEIGDGSRIGPHCTIEGPTRIGRDNVFHGHAAIGAFSRRSGDRFAGGSNAPRPATAAGTQALTR